MRKLKVKRPITTLSRIRMETEGQRGQLKKAWKGASNRLHEEVNVSGHKALFTGFTERIGNKWGQKKTVKNESEKDDINSKYQ